MQFSHSTRIDAPAEEVFNWHARAGAFDRLQPPWAAAEVVAHTPGRDGRSIGKGARVEIRIPIGPFRRRWVVEHTLCDSPRQFVDEQQAGPFRHWTHSHTIKPDGPDACFLEDRIDFELPGGAAARRLCGPTIRRALDRMFAYRHRTTINDIAAHRRTGHVAMKIAVTGSSGLVGSALVPFLTTGGHEVVRVVRRPATQPDELFWAPADEPLDPARIEGIDAVVHLAGESIAAGRWNDEKKRRIRDSRVRSTRLLAEAIAKAENGPKVLVCASAVGYYGDRGDEVLTEASAPGGDFLADVCQEWEGAADPAREAGTRVAHLRFGMILSPQGGALAKMLTPFKLGAGGKIGSGRQYWSWIAIDDVLDVILRALTDENLSGPINTVSPTPVTCTEFTKTLGRVLSRPTIFPMPAFAARLAFGEMADALLMASQRVLPERLVMAGHHFRHPELEVALRHLLGR